MLVGAQRSAVGWCNNKASSLWRPALSDALSLPPPHLPTLQMQVQRCQVKHEGSFFFLSCPVVPSQKENTWSPKRGRWGRGGGEGDLVIATPFQCLLFAKISHFYPPSSHSSPASPLFPSLSPSLLPLSFRCLALSCQTEKWQARQGSSAWGDRQERTEASRHTCTDTHAPHTHINMVCVPVQPVHM